MATFTQHKDLLIECPFDKNHKIAIRNQIKHIIECEKKIESKFSVCIYNASHRMARHEFATHVKCCPDGRQHVRDRFDYQQQQQQQQQSSSSVVDSTINSKVKAIEPQIVSKPESCDEEATEDNWDDDNHPSYSVMDWFRPSDHSNTNLVENKSQKLTKNQKKRNRRKSAIGSKLEPQIDSIWD